MEDAREAADGSRDAGRVERCGPLPGKRDRICLGSPLREAVGDESQGRDAGDGAERVGVEGAGMRDRRCQQLEQICPPGSPPAITLPRMLISGVIPSVDCIPPGATRKPVTTSSKMSTVPLALHAARATAMNA